MRAIRLAGAPFENFSVLVLDQLALPARETMIDCKEAEAVARAIETMQVRGAPAIGVAAAMGLALGLERFALLKKRKCTRDEVLQAWENLCQRFRKTRPTAVNLFWAIDTMSSEFQRVQKEMTTWDTSALENLCRKMGLKARAVAEEDIALCRAIGRHGQALLPMTATILTHCNAGALATGGYGTALGVIRAAVEAGKKVKTYCDETRPYLQGARLTAWELHRDGIEAIVITDNMAAHIMKTEKIDAVIVGADRIARNGDVANKIGTYGLAILCHHHKIPFYVAAPSTTFDLSIATGASIVIEERSAREVAELAGQRLIPEGVSVRHPAFDVTPASLISAIISEKGVIRPVTEEAVCKQISSALS